METKVCTKCGIEFPATTEWFYASNTRKGGLASSCKKCKNLVNHEWEKHNKGKRNELSKDFYWNNTEKCREWSNNYRIKNPEKVAMFNKRWAINNPEIRLKHDAKSILKKQIGATPPPELVELKLITLKIKRLCKTSNN